jgi:DNA-binding CsgD family transcriptional regulator
MKLSAVGGNGAVLSTIPRPEGEASIVASAREAFFRGDLSTCLSTLKGATFVDRSLRTDALFLQARALMRSQRSPDVVKLLEPTLTSFSSIDEICTARMLYGHAVAFAQDLDRGLEVLAATAMFADSEHVHPSIRAELSYYRAFAYWAKREYSEASRFAVQAEVAGLDVLSVRATELLAFIALAEARYAEALHLFQRARKAYVLCQGRDVALATQIVYQIAFLEMNLRSATIRGSHADPDGRTIPGASFGPAVRTAPRMLMTAADAWSYALDGNRAKAIRKSINAIDVAPSSAWRVWALAAGAMLCEALQETAHAECLAEDAEKLATAIDWDSTTDEERISLLWLAEVCAAVNPTVAVRALDRYDGVTSAMDPTRVLRDSESDPRMVAWDAYVRGLVARTIGNHEGAADWLRKAVKYFLACEHLWRAALALIELASTPVDTTAEAPLERAAVIIRENFPDSFLAARLGWARLYLDPNGRTLTPSQVDILRRVLENQSVDSIARETFRSESTVRKHIAAVEAAFDAHSIPELIIMCFRRGIVPPSVTTPVLPMALPRIS